MVYRAALEAASTAARAAAGLLKPELARPDGPRHSGGALPVNALAEAAIATELMLATPWPMRGKETGLRRGERDDHLWLVDPHDGAEAALAGWCRGTAVSIGLVRLGDRLPVVGVVLVLGWPDADDRLYAWAEGEGPLTVDGRPVPRPRLPQQLGPHDVVLFSQAAAERPRGILPLIAPARYEAAPSIAARLARVAAGEASAAVSLSGPVEWDLCAGAALLRAVGGVVADETGRELLFDAEGQAAVARCTAGAPALAAQLAARPWPLTLPPEDLRRPLMRPAGRVASAGRLARAQGCLIGHLAGDSLGQLVEFRDPGWIRTHYPEGAPVDLADGGTWGLLAGQPTDDGELMLALARRLATDGRFDAEAVVSDYAAWLVSPPFDVGATTSTALTAAAEAPPGRRAAAAAARALTGSKANGALMRVAPIGLAACGAPALAAGWAAADAALTHPNPTCLAASAAYAAAIAVLVDGGSVKEAVAAARSAAGDGEGAAEVLGLIDAAAAGPPTHFLVQQGFVGIALRNAFHHLMAGTPFDAAMHATVGAGGDTDTNGCILGALLGAAQGREAVPPAWRRLVLTCRPLPEAGALNPRPEVYWADDLLALAEALLLLGSGRAGPGEVGAATVLNY